MGEGMDSDTGAQGQVDEADAMLGDAGREGLAWLVPDWPAPPVVRAAATLRVGGVSAPPYASLNLAGHVGDDPLAVAANRERLGAALGVPQALTDPELWLNQVHSAQVVSATERAGSGGVEADGVHARAPGQVCAVLTADCLPLLLCDTAGTRVAAAHAGWRGLAAGVIEQTVAAFDCPGEDLLVWLGPAIGPDTFEVGPEVRATFLDHDARAARAFRQSPFHDDGQHWLADIYSLARQRLSACGIERVYGGHWCTVSDATRFYSYRRDGVTGRMASLVWLAAG